MGKALRDDSTCIHPNNVWSEIKCKGSGSFGNVVHANVKPLLYFELSREEWH